MSVWETHIVQILRERERERERELYTTPGGWCAVLARPGSHIPALLTGTVGQTAGTHTGRHFVVRLS